MAAKTMQRLLVVAALLCGGYTEVATAQFVPPGTDVIFAFSDITPITELVLQTNAGSFTFSATGYGWWNSEGRHNTFNYGAGTGISFSGPAVFHNYFVFDVASIATATVLNGYLHLWQLDGGYKSLQPGLLFSIWNVTSPLDQVATDTKTRTDIFDDLGSGTGYGSRSVTAADNGAFVNVVLNRAAVSDINAELRGDGLMGFGGAVTIPIAAIPEPATYALMLAGLGLLGVAVSRRKLPASS